MNQEMATKNRLLAAAAAACVISGFTMTQSIDLTKRSLVAVMSIALASSVLARKSNSVIRGIIFVRFTLRKLVWNKSVDELFDLEHDLCKPSDIGKTSRPLNALIHTLDAIFTIGKKKTTEQKRRSISLSELSPSSRKIMLDQTMAVMTHFYQLMLFSPWSMPQPNVTKDPKLSQEMPVYWIEANEFNSKDLSRVVMYIHGGGHVLGSLESYASFCGELSRACKCRVLFVDYSLITSTFGSIQMQLDQLYRAYVGAQSDYENKLQVVVVGDSAGGGHTLRLLQKLITTSGMVEPVGGVMMSPWMYLTDQTNSFWEQRHDLFFQNQAPVHMVGEAIAKASSNDTLPETVSPLLASFHGLPPLFVCCGVSECLLEDSRATVRKARIAKVPVEAEFHTYGIHCYPIFGNAFTIPEYLETLEKICVFIRQRYR